MSIVVEVQVQPPDLFRAVSGETVGGQKVRDLIFRKRKDNLESQWSAFTADDLEAEVSDFIPAGVGFFKSRCDMQFLADNWYTFIRKTSC